MSDNSDVQAFHEKFQVPVRTIPQSLETSESKFRIKFMHEELKEYKLAVKNGSLEKQFDALLDLVYVAHGTALMHGFPWAEGWRRVQVANMAKISAKDAGITGCRHLFDVVKPEGWVAPDLSDLVSDQPNAVKDKAQHVGPCICPECLEQQAFDTQITQKV